MDSAEAQEIQEEQEITVVPKRIPEIELLELENPSYLLRSTTFQNMIRKFYDSIKPPTVTFETMMNFMLQMVNSIYTAKQSGQKPDSIKIRFILGFQDKILNGFILYYMLPNGMPHVMTIEIPYVYSESIRVSYAFGKELRRSKKKWSCSHIACTIANERFFKVVNRGFKNPRVMAYVVAEDIRVNLIKC